MRIRALKTALWGSVFLVSLSVLIFQIPVVMAQDAGDEEFVIEEVVVTARKREERLQEVPLSVTTFSAADIEAKSLVSLKDLGQFTPNLNFFNMGQGGNSGAVVFMRGVGQTDTGTFWDPGVGIYVDGVYMGRMQGVDLALLELQRVEVLRGPQGTLFGKNTIGGAINIVTVKPGDEFSAYADVTTGSFDRLDGRANLNVPLVPGIFSMKITGSSQNRDGFGTRIDWHTGKKIDEMGNRDRLNGRAAFNWTPNENVGVLLSLDAAKIREYGAVREVVKFTEPPLARLFNMFVNPPYSAATFATENHFVSFANGENANELDAWGAALTVDWDLGTVALKSITSYRDTDAVNGTDPDGSFYNIIDLRGDVKQDQFSQELQLSGLSFGGRLNWVAGLYYFAEDAFMSQALLVYRELADIIGLDISFVRRYWTDNKSYAAYTQGTYDVNEKLALTVGLRYTTEKKDLARDRFRQLSGIVFVPLDSRDATWSAFSPRISLDYKWSDDLMTYVSAARGFKSGGFNAISLNSAEFTRFDPEYIWTYEAGLRSEWYDQRLRFNASVFYSDYTDIQFTVIRGDPNTGEPITVIDNAAKARIKGFELEVVAMPVSQLLLTAGVGYTDAAYTRLDAGLPITLDTRFVKTPKWSTTLSAQYTIPLKGGADIVGQLDWAYKSKIEHDQLNSLVGRQNPYSLVNARLTYVNTDNKWSVSLFGTNLTDERYIMAATDLSNALAFAEVQWARPREWGLNFRYNF